MNAEKSPVAHNVDHEEIAKFEAVASRWWDLEGEFKPLHRINPLRLGYIAERSGGLFGKKVLDVGCGAGVLAAALASHSPKVRLTLCDVSAPAVEASRATLAANGLAGDVFASNVFSEVNGRFDMIISNPPFHDGLQTSLEAAQALIRGAVRHLNSGGELRIVANAFLPYPQVLDETFGFHEVIAQTGRFKVYRTIMTHQVKK